MLKRFPASVNLIKSAPESLKTYNFIQSLPKSFF